MGMINPVDAKLSFGAGKYSDGACPDTLSLNMAQTERMKVEAVVTSAFAGGTSIALKLQGSDDGTTFEDVASAGSIVTAELTKGASFTLPIPDGVNKKFLKVTFAATGTFTAGELEAYLDTYLGI